MRVKEVMTTEIVTVSPDNSVRQAVKLMLDNQISGVPVVDDEGRLLGILSEGDLIRRTELISGTIASLDEMALPSEERANAYVRRNSWRVGDVMTSDPVTIDEEASLACVAKLICTSVRSSESRLLGVASWSVSSVGPTCFRQFWSRGRMKLLEGMRPSNAASFAGSEKTPDWKAWI